MNTKAKEVFIIYTAGFYKDLFERTVATAAQAALAYLSTVATGLVTDVDFAALASLVGFAVLFAVLKAFGAGALNANTGASFGTTVPKDTVAAVEVADREGDYRADAAAPYAEGTPVDVVREDDSPVAVLDADYPTENDGPVDLDENNKGL